MAVTEGWHDTWDTEGPGQGPDVSGPRYPGRYGTDTESLRVERQE